jgi:uncharacterized protein (DUF342 family)
MSPSNKSKRHGDTAWADYDEHLERAEDRLESAARKTDASFREHTAGAEAKLEQAEDKLEAAAQKTDASFREHTAGAEAKLEQVEDKLEAAARKAENR